MRLRIGDIPVLGDKGLDPTFGKVRASNVEKGHGLSTVVMSIIVILVMSLAMFLVALALGDIWTLGDYVNNVFCNTIALVFVVAFLDTIVTSGKEGRRKRDEARMILRYNRIITPDIDMYLVRKNMVVTPNGKTVKKFQVDSEFTIQDMRDMYGPSELVSDVGISKIKRYAHFQSKLRADFEKMVEGVDFTNYPEIAEAAMNYISATSYGEAALDAVLGYEDGRSGTKSLRTMVVAMIREEPDDARFIDAAPMMKNVHLVHQMINDQEAAVSTYLRLIKRLEEEDPIGANSESRDYE
ncbi:MAG: hypothetical protein IJ026_03780 [Candidatus Methanomethylophilaceae archaeon]|nr:hypothetical protein [Candidatus Methanomethylophilaceae archaeon]